MLGFPTTDGWAYFRCRVLPFGATASVYSFIRVSRSLHHILVTYLNALCTVFFDDFPMLEPSQGATVLKSAVSAVLNCLGFWHDTEGKKQLKFDSSFIALGALIDLRDLASGEFVVSNKPGRIDKLIGLLRQARQEGRILPEVASVIQGHLTFASGFYLSKTLRFLTKEISKASRLRTGGAQLASLCELAETMLRSTPPRRIAMKHWQEPILLFSDGALEDGVPSAGALMFDPITARCEAVAFETPCELVNVWSPATAGHYICQLEAWAVLCARKQWGDIRGAPCVHWVDNEAATLAVAKGASDSPTLASIAHVYQAFELLQPSVTWFERVASFSNPADAPSRHQVQQAVDAFGAKAVSPVSMEAKVQALLQLSANPLSVISLSLS